MFAKVNGKGVNKEGVGLTVRLEDEDTNKEMEGRFR